MNRKWPVILLIIIIFAAAFAFPVVASRMLHGDTKWMEFLSSYSGSIIGGMISGVVTYSAIYLTLSAQRNERFIESFPPKLKQIDDLLESLVKIRENPNRQAFIRGEPPFQEFSQEFMPFDASFEDVVLHAVNIDVDVYRQARRLRVELTELAARYAADPEISLLHYGEQNNYGGLESRSIHLRDAYVTRVNSLVKHYESFLRAHRTNLLHRFNKLTKSRG